MPDARPLPTVIGQTENALRALLTRTLSTTRIKTYPAWVVLNAASNAGATAPSVRWRRAVAEALKVEPGVVDDVVAQLSADGLARDDGSLTARGTAELVTVRTAVATTTSRLIEEVSEEAQAAARSVLDHVRRRAEELLSLAS